MNDTYQEVSVKLYMDSLIDSFKDNGIGFNEQENRDKSQGFGLTIVRMLAEQLKGTFISENDHGNRSVLTFTISLDK